jgi:hypothetical protein
MDGKIIAHVQLPHNYTTQHKTCWCETQDKIAGSAFQDTLGPSLLYKGQKTSDFTISTTSCTHPEMVVLGQLEEPPCKIARTSSTTLF